jgi:hypothetical protein
MLKRYVLLMVLCLLLLDLTRGTRALAWRDSWDGFHSFLVFAPEPPQDAAVVTAAAPRYDFGWNTRQYNAIIAGNPQFIFGQYASGTQNNWPSHTLAWYQANHPDWILYACDRTTPITEYDYAAVIPDFTNPAVIDDQWAYLVSIGAGSTLPAVAMDNFAFDNSHANPSGTGYTHACGVWQGGVWVQKFLGLGSYASVEDPPYTDGMIAYAAEMRRRMQASTTKTLLIVNNDPKVVTGDAARSAALIAAVDGILMEGGPFNAGQLSDPRELWLRQIRFIELMQQTPGKAYYTLEIPDTVGTASQPFLQFALASYYLAKGHATGLNIPVNSGGGGYDPGTLGWYGV